MFDMISLAFQVSFETRTMFGWGKPTTHLIKPFNLYVNSSKINQPPKNLLLVKVKRMLIWLCLWAKQNK